jgi:hypothetical protein
MEYDMPALPFTLTFRVKVCDRELVYYLNFLEYEDLVFNTNNSLSTTQSIFNQFLPSP